MKKINRIKILKASGEEALFDPSKLKRSLQKSGAEKHQIEMILEEIGDSIYEGMPTREIYQQAFSLLRKFSRPAAARYKLKQAIMELGPSGYPFENFIGEILRNQGYQVQVGLVLQGNCVQHEVDVIAENDTEYNLVECKFHGRQIFNCDVKIPLYIRSRFIDLEIVWNRSNGNSNQKHQGWIITNTRFTSDATQYGKCVGLNLIGWDYPRKGSLKEMISKSGLHPVTSLTSLSKKDKQKVLESGMVMCYHLVENPEKLKELGIRGSRLDAVLEEASNLCKMKLKHGN